MTVYAIIELNIPVVLALGCNVKCSLSFLIHKVSLSSVPAHDQTLQTHPRDTTLGWATYILALKTHVLTSARFSQCLHTRQQWQGEEASVHSGWLHLRLLPVGAAEDNTVGRERR